MSQIKNKGKWEGKKKDNYSVEIRIYCSIVIFIQYSCDTLTFYLDVLVETCIDGAVLGGKFWSFLHPNEHILDDGFLVEFGSSKELGGVMDEVALSKGLWWKHVFWGSLGVHEMLLCTWSYVLDEIGIKDGIRVVLSEGTYVWTGSYLTRKKILVEYHTHWNKVSWLKDLSKDTLYEMHCPRKLEYCLLCYFNLCLL